MLHAFKKWITYMVRQTSVWQMVRKFWFICLIPQRLTLVSKYCKKRYQSQINQNFWTVFHTGVCFTFSRLAAKMIAKFWGRSLKIQPRSSLKSIQILQILIGGMNFKERSQKNQISSVVRSGFWAIFINVSKSKLKYSNYKMADLTWWYLAVDT